MKKTLRSRAVLSAALALLAIPALPAQEAVADTSSFGYKAGYHIGSWLPFLIIVILVVLIIRKSGGQSRE